MNWPGTSRPVADYDLNQFRVPEAYVDDKFVRVVASGRHVCATRANGTVACWGADAIPSTRAIDVFVGKTIINTGQTWVPQPFRFREPDGLRPTFDVRILRIEPTIRQVSLRPGATVRLSTIVFGRQDIRDDSLGLGAMNSPKFALIPSNFDLSYHFLPEAAAPDGGSEMSSAKSDNFRNRRESGIWKTPLRSPYP